MTIKNIALAGVLSVFGLVGTADRAAAQVSVGPAGIQLGGQSGSSVFVPYSGGVRNATIMNSNGTVYQPRTGAVYAPTPAATYYPTTAAPNYAPVYSSTPAPTYYSTPTPRYSTIPAPTYTSTSGYYSTPAPRYSSPAVPTYFPAPSIPPTGSSYIRIR